MNSGVVVGLMVVLWWLLVFAGWVTHIYVSIQAKAWVFMIAMALLAPVGVVHGWATWLGYDWLN